MKSSGARVITGDCLEKMREMPENSVDSVVTDPPYGLAFMGKEWDTVHQGWHEAWAREALRVLKPGGYLLAFGATRTYHRLACAIEDAGFEIRDSISWLYGSGFPKSHDVSKAIDKMGGKNISWFAPWLKAERKKRGMSAKALAEYFKTSPERINHGGCVSNWELGLNVPTVEQFNKLCEVLELPFERIEEVEREVVGHNANGAGNGSVVGLGLPRVMESEYDITAPATQAAQQWQGWGTALKPSHEPIVMARKPLSEKSVARNLLEYGTGAINVDGCRVGGQLEGDPNRFKGTKPFGSKRTYAQDSYSLETEMNPVVSSQGRWPANLILSHHEDCNGECVEGCPVAELDRQSGTLKSGDLKPYKQANRTHYSGGIPEVRNVNFKGDKGGASRFFYIAKASRKERNAGLEGMPEKRTRDYEGGEIASQKTPDAKGGRRSGQNNHPTVKPIALMRYLVRMVTPPGGIVLDPFTGSGSTGCAAVLEGMDFIGIEREEEYVSIAEKRIAHYEEEGSGKLFA